MKYFAFVLTLFTLASINAHAACEAQAETFVEGRFGVEVSELRDLGMGGGEGRRNDREVWVKAANGSTYSIFFWNGLCDSISRHVVW